MREVCPLCVKITHVTFVKIELVCVAIKNYTYNQDYEHKIYQ